MSTTETIFEKGHVEAVYTLTDDASGKPTRLICNIKLKKDLTSNDQTQAYRKLISDILCTITRGFRFDRQTQPLFSKFKGPIRMFLSDFIHRITRYGQSKDAFNPNDKISGFVLEKGKLGGLSLVLAPSFRTFIDYVFSDDDFNILVESLLSIFKSKITPFTESLSKI